MENVLDVVIIGAGISGLCAAHLLQTFDKNLNIAILEARDRVGGRTHTFEHSEVSYVDLGGAYIGPAQNHISRVAKDLGVETYKIFKNGKNTEHFGGEPSFIQNDCSTWNICAKLDYYQQIRQLDRMCDQVPILSPWDAKNTAEWDAITVKEYFDKSCWTNYAKKRMHQVFYDVMICELYEVSLLYYIWYLKSAGGFNKIANIEHVGQVRKFHGGSQQISKKLAQILGEKVITCSPVCNIDQNGDHVFVRCSNGKLYKTQYVITAIPVALLPTISFTPPLSATKNHLYQRMPMGSVIKTVTYYETAWWREQGLSGVLIADSESGPVNGSLDDSKPDGSYPALVGEIFGEKAQYWCTRTGEERRQAVCEQYARAFCNDKALIPRYYIDKNWLAEKYSGGCYVSIMSCGVLTRFGKELRKSEGKIFFAGTETACAWPGYMNGAVEAGERAAREVLHALGRIPEEEIYQQEPDSPEISFVSHGVTWYQTWLPTVPIFLMTVAAVSVGTAVAITMCKRSN